MSKPWKLETKPKDLREKNVNTENSLEMKSKGLNQVLLIKIASANHLKKCSSLSESEGLLRQMSSETS